MPTVPFAFTVPMGTREPNALAGSQFEFMARPTRVRVFLTQDPAAGVGEAQVFFGQELEMPQSVITEAAAAGQGPIVPDDLVLNDVAAPGDRIVIELAETGGAADAVIRGRAEFMPL